MQRYTITRQKTVRKINRLMRAFDRLQVAESFTLDDDPDSDYGPLFDRVVTDGAIGDATLSLENLRDRLIATRGRDCHCGEPATELAARPSDGSRDVVDNIRALLAGELVERYECSNHASEMVVGYSLCPCGERVSHEVTLWPHANQKVRKLDSRLWEEFQERTYLLCGSCAIEANAESASPWKDGRVAPEQAEILGQLLRRVGVMRAAGLETREAFSMLDRTIGGSALAHVIPMLVEDIEQLQELAGEPTPGDRAIVTLLMADPNTRMEALDNIEHLDAVERTSRQVVPDIEPAPVVELMVAAD